MGGLDDRVSESLLWELFVQSGPVGKCLDNLLKHTKNHVEDMLKN